MTREADGAGGASFTFDETSPYYQSGFVENQCVPMAGGPDGESVWGALWAGGGDARGQVESAMKNAHPDGLETKAAAWDDAFTEVNGFATTLATAISTLFSSWSGDDADQARQILDGLAATIGDQRRTTWSLAAELRNVAADLAQCKATWGHDSSTLGGFGNWVSGNEDRAAADDYHQLMTNISTYLDRMPQQVPTQVKVDGSFVQAGGLGPGGGPGGAGLPPSLGGGLGAAHAAGALTPHIGSPHLPAHPAAGVGGHTGGSIAPAAHIPDANPGGHYGAGAPILNPAAGTAVDTSSTLAGLDGGAGFGAGSGGAGLGASGLGSGGGGLGTAGSLGGPAGGPGAMTAGGLGLGPGSGLAGTATGAGAGATGRGGIMAPMGGVRGGGDDDERERSTWLTEDDDVWGTTDAPPPVLGG